MVNQAANSGDPPGSSMSEEELQRTASFFHAISSAIGEQEEDPSEGVIAFEWPLADVLRLVPREYWVNDPLPPDITPLKVTVIVEDLFGQLARGRVTSSVAQLLFGVSPSFVTAEAFSDQTTVSLPLAMIVTALDPSVFKARTTQEQRGYKTEQLPELFCQPTPRPLVRPSEEKASSPTQKSAPAIPSGIEIPAAVRLPGLRAFGAPPEALPASLSGALPSSSPGAPPPPPAPPHAAAFTIGAAPSTPPQPPADKEEAAPRVVSELAMVQSVVEATEASAAASFEMSLYDVLNLIPRKHLVTTKPPPETREQKVSIVVKDLLQQLRAGRVALPLPELLSVVPLQFIQTSALEDQSPVALPLRAVVGAISTSILRQNMPKATRSYRTEGLPDFFTQPAVSGAWPTAPERAAPEKTALPEPPPPAAAAPQEPTPEPEEEMERLGGVNLNTATVEQLVVLPRVSRALAEAIVQHRAVHGPFKDVFALSEVPRIGRKTFRSITGMPYNAKRLHRRRRLAALLNLPPGRLSHLPTVAKALASRPGFAGCVISDQDGFILAQCGAERLAEAVGAVVPRMMKGVSASMSELGASAFDSVSIHVAGSMFTVVPAGDIILTAFHQSTRLTSGQFRLIQRVAIELQWLISRRGYVSG